MPVGDLEEKKRWGWALHSIQPKQSVQFRSEQECAIFGHTVHSKCQNFKYLCYMHNELSMTDGLSHDHSILDRHTKIKLTWICSTLTGIAIQHTDD
jgi:hypothetical protein